MRHHTAPPCLQWLMGRPLEYIAQSLLSIEHLSDLLGQLVDRVGFRQKLRSKIERAIVTAIHCPAHSFELKNPGAFWQPGKCEDEFVVQCRRYLTWAMQLCSCFCKNCAASYAMQGASVRVAGGISAAEIVLPIVIHIVIQTTPGKMENVTKTASDGLSDPSQRYHRIFPVSN
jgi:hypothetical protein